jgi:hypothetical protein
MWKRKIRHYILITVAMMPALIQSCAPVYRPNTVFTPMFDRQGQFRSMGSFGNNGLNLHAGYTITDNLAITGGMTYASDVGDPGETFFSEIGAGWYASPSVFRVEVLSGIGFGVARATGTYDFITPQRTIEARGVYGRYYLQPSFGVSIAMVDLSLSSRAAWVNFFRFEETAGNGEEAQGISGLFMEPAMTLGVGPENFKIFGQLGFSLPSRALEFDHLPVLLSFGIRLNLDPQN